ncbi:hypothetical protein H8E88_10285 [candidate division KSB1 bacterium]|nr:hypothetical protein [candidate division KSB1 bacterium]
MYSPKISAKLIPILYRIAKEKRVPMTTLVDSIIESYLDKVEVGIVRDEKEGA